LSLIIQLKEDWVSCLLSI